MADRKYLFRRGGAWTVRFRLPQRFGGGLLQRTLGTGDIATARRFRDLYVMPFLAGEDLYEATSSLIDKALQLGQAQDKRSAQLKAAFDPDADDDAPTLRTQVDRYLAHIQRGQVRTATSISTG